MNGPIKFVGRAVAPPVEQPIPTVAAEVYSGEVFKIVQWSERRFDGSLAIFEKVLVPSSVSVLPVTSSNMIILANQEQPGRRPHLGLLGGRCGIDEEPESAVIRELGEEAAIHPSVVRYLGAWRPFEKIEWCRYYYTVHGFDTGRKTVRRAGEIIELVPVSVHELCDLVIAGAIGDSYVQVMVLRNLVLGGVGKVAENLFGGIPDL